MLCNLNFRFYLRAFRCSEESAGSLPPVIFLNGHNIRSTSCLPSGRFRVSIKTSWVVVPSMYETHYKHNPLVSLSVSNNNLSLLIHRCMYYQFPITTSVSNNNIRIFYLSQSIPVAFEIQKEKKESKVDEQKVNFLLIQKGRYIGT